MEDAIFNTLKNEFEKKGIDTTGFKLNTNFTDFFYKHTEDVVSIISKLSPGTLYYYKYKPGIIDKLAALLMLCSIVTSIIMALFYNITWHLIPLFIVTIILFFVSNKSEAYKCDISGYRTIKDLVAGMKKRMIM